MVDKKRKKLDAEELYAFSDEMGMMLESGISYIQAITMMLDESEGGEEKEILSEMENTIATTGSLARAIEDAEIFPDYFVEMTKMGEQTGKMDNVLNSLSHHYEREMAIEAAVKSAITYPLMMLIMMFIIIIVLVSEIMPVFSRVFAQLGTTMDGVSGGFLAVGGFLHSYGWIFLLALIALAIVIFVMSKSENGRWRLIKFAYNKKKFREVHGKIATSRFASAMAMTISSGMDVLQAIEISSKIVKAPGFDEKIEKCKDAFGESMDLGKAFGDSGIFGGLYGRMAILGAKTGNLENVLEKVADTYQEEADRNINEMIEVVEPTLVIVLSIIVGVILLSVMLPLLNIMSGMI